MSVDAGSRWRRVRFALPVALVIHLLFWVSLPTGLLDPVFNDSVHRIGKGGDFLQFYQAGSNLLRGRSIYQYAKLDRVSHGPHNKYPPLLPATLGVGTQALAPGTAYALWAIVIGGLFVALQLLLRRLVGPEHFPAVLCLSLAFTPFYLELFHGQTNCLMAVLLALVLVGLMRGPRQRDALALAVSFNVKLNTVLLLPAMLRRAHLRWLIRACALAVLLFLPYFAFFPGDLGYFLRYAFAPANSYFYQAGNLGTYPLIEELVFLFSYGGQAVTATQTGWTAAVLLVTSLVHWRARRVDPIDLASLWMCTYFLAFKFIWEHHLVMLLPILAVEYLRNHRRLVTALWILLALPTAFILLDVDLGPGYTEVQPYWTGAASALYHASKVVPLVALYWAVAARLLAWRPRPAALAAALASLCLMGGLLFALHPATSKDECTRALRSLRARDIPSARLHLDASVAAVRTWPDSVFLYSELLDRLGDREGARMMRQRHPASQ